jgi:hypothetical protein
MSLHSSMTLVLSFTLTLYFGFQSQTSMVIEMRKPSRTLLPLA